MNSCEIVKGLTIDEKIKLLSGDKAWHTVGFAEKGLPAIMMTDGPHGLRKQTDSPSGINDSAPATCFPSAVTSGATWDRELVARMARAIGQEALAAGVSVVLGPGVNIKRNPKCGRNFEYFSEDPYLAGEMAAAYINAMQSLGVATSLKHFACNSQEYKRHNSDSQVDERTLREIYLRAFEIAVKKAQPATIMAAYPRLNGEFCACNKRLLQDILRKEWGFRGLVVSDWGAMARHVDGIKAGCDLGMPGGTGYEDDVVRKAVEDGTLPMEALDECCRRVVDLALKGAQVQEAHKGAVYSIEAHDELAAKVAAEGAVLLKNDGILPLKRGCKVLLVGHMAREARYQGAGSSHIVPNKLTNITNVMADCTYVAGYDAHGDATQASLDEVAQAAREADAVVVAAGLPPRYESEGFDRNTLDLPDGVNKVVESAASANKNTVVVLMAGGAVLLPWLDKVRAVLFAGLMGQAGARGICDILMGKVNPSGHLTETWPLSLDSVPCEPQYSVKTQNVEYREGIYVGYRYYDKALVAVQFPFGHGLSYTEVEYTAINVKKTNGMEQENSGAAGAGGSASNAILSNTSQGNEWPKYTVTITVKNAGKMDGAEVVQVYVGNPSEGVVRAQKELRGYEKVFLKAGERKSVCIELDDRSFSVYDAAAGAWKTIGGKYTIMAGSSSADIKLKQEIQIEGSDEGSINSPCGDGGSGSWWINPQASSRPSHEEWLALMARAVEAKLPRDFDNMKKGDFGMSNTMGELAKHSDAVRHYVQKLKERIAHEMGVDVNSDDEVYTMAISSSLDCALHGVVLFGMMQKETAQALLDAANGKISDERFYAIVDKEQHK